VPRLVSVSLVVVAWLILLSISGCGSSGGGQSAPPPPEVSVAQVLQKRVKDWDEFIIKTSPRPRPICKRRGPPGAWPDSISFQP
jgi:hypothetical protein